MPRVHTQTAKSDIYATGIRIPDDKTKSGYRRDMSQPAPDGDRLLVRKGQKYFSWTFRYGGKHISTVYPKQSQLTQSDFLSRAYEIMEEIDAISGLDIEGLQELRDDIVSRCEELRDETQEKLDNMPEQLQEAPTGELLSERVEALDNFISELEGVDIEADDEEGWKEENREEGQTDEELDDKWQEYLQEEIDSIIGQIQECSLDV